MADTSLIFNIIARDRTSATLAKIRASAGSTASVVAKTLGPALAPVAAVATGGVLALGSAFAAAGAGAGVFGAVAATAMTEVNENATKVQDLTDKVKLYGKEAEVMAARGEDNAGALKKQAAAALELESRLANMPHDVRNATLSFIGMKDSWSTFVDANKPVTFGIMASGYKIIGQAIQHLQPFFDAGAGAARRLVGVVGEIVNGGGLDTLGQRAAPALASLTEIIINIGTAVGRTFGAFASDGQGILDWIEQATARWAEFSNVKAGGGLQSFVDYFHAQGPGVISLLGNLATAAMNTARAVGPLAPISMAIAAALTALIAAMPPAVITALVAAWIAYSVAVKAYSIASAIGAAAQWAMNSALLASPITWIVLAIAGLVAIIVLVATKTRFFQTVWGAVWGFMKTVGAWFAGPFSQFFVNMWNKITASLNRARGQIGTAVGAIKNFFVGWWNLYARIAGWIIAKGVSLVNWFRSAPGRLRGSLSNMFSGLWTGFRSVVNKIIGGWNRLSFGIPGFSFAGMSFGGMSVGTPDIPYLASGGRVQRDGLIFAHAGEEISKKAVVSRTGRGTGTQSGGSGAPTITINGSNAKVVRVLLELLREGIRDKGGDVVKVLTPQ